MIDIDTKPNDNSVSQYISDIKQTRRQLDAQLIQQLMERVSGQEAVMWGKEAIGFGIYHRTHKTGREWDWPVLSFVPGVDIISVYVMPGLEDYDAILKKLGKHKTSTNCIYINHLKDINMQALEDLMTAVFADMQEQYDCK